MAVVVNFSLVVLVSIIFLLTPSHGKDMVGDREVKVILHPANFHTAFETCRSADMDLLMIYNSTEELQIIELAKKYNMTQFWLAVTDIGHESLFVSLSTGKRLTYSNWHEGEPNNYDGKEHCVDIRMLPNDKNGWNDIDCSITLNFFCEMPVS